MPIQAPPWTEFLTCPICRNEFDFKSRSPISLACGHTICSACLSNLQRRQCPFDATTINLNIDELPVNIALLQLISNSSEQNKSFSLELLKQSFPKDLADSDKNIYLDILSDIKELALYLRPSMTSSIGQLSRSIQRKLVTLINCQLVEEEGRARAARAARSLGERSVTELILQHQNPQQLSTNLWAAVRARGCQFLGPAMQEEVLRLVLLALEDGSALSRKVLVMFVVQRLEPHFPQASKTSIGHVVQLLYRASCFKVTKREGDSSLMQLKDEFRTYECLRREHDAQIVQIATEAGLRIAPDQWSSLLYGDITHKSHMQSIIDKLQTPQSFSLSIQELVIALQRTGDPGNLSNLRTYLDQLATIDPNSEGSAPDWKQLADAISAAKIVVTGLVNFIMQHGSKRGLDSGGAQHVSYKTSLCRNLTEQGSCSRGSNCTFAHSQNEIQVHRNKGTKKSSKNDVDDSHNFDDKMKNDDLNCSFNVEGTQKLSRPVMGTHKSFGYNASEHLNVLAVRGNSMVSNETPVAQVQPMPRPTSYVFQSGEIQIASQCILPPPGHIVVQPQPQLLPPNQQSLLQSPQSQLLQSGQAAVIRSGQAVIESGLQVLHGRQQLLPPAQPQQHPLLPPGQPQPLQPGQQQLLHSCPPQGIRPGQQQMLQQNQEQNIFQASPIYESRVPAELLVAQHALNPNQNSTQENMTQMRKISTHKPVEDYSQNRQPNLSQPVTNKEMVSNTPDPNSNSKQNEIIESVSLPTKAGSSAYSFSQISTTGIAIRPITTLATKSLNALKNRKEEIITKLENLVVDPSTTCSVVTTTVVEPEMCRPPYSIWTSKSIAPSICKLEKVGVQHSTSGHTDSSKGSRSPDDDLLPLPDGPVVSKFGPISRRSLIVQRTPTEYLQSQSSIGDDTSPTPVIRHPVPAASPMTNNVVFRQSPQAAPGITTLQPVTFGYNGEVSYIALHLPANQVQPLSAHASMVAAQEVVSFDHQLMTNAYQIRQAIPTGMTPPSGALNAPLRNQNNLLVESQKMREELENLQRKISNLNILAGEPKQEGTGQCDISKEKDNLRKELQMIENSIKDREQEISNNRATVENHDELINWAPYSQNISESYEGNVGEQLKAFNNYSPDIKYNETNMQEDFYHYWPSNTFTDM